MTLPIAIAAIAALIVTGTDIKNTTAFPLPQGLGIGILLLFTLVLIFCSRQQTIFHRNFVLDNALMYNAKQHDNAESQLAKNRSLREKGKIFEQEYNSRKDQISPKKSDLYVKK